MFAIVVVEAKILRQPLMQAVTVGVSPQIKMLIFDGPPKPLDENIVQGAALRVHTNGYLFFYQWLEKIMAGELTALIGIEDPGFTPP